MNSLNLKTYISQALEAKGLSLFWTENLTLLLLFILILLIGWVIFWVSRKIIVGVFNRVSRRTKTSFDDLLLQNKVPRLLSYIPFLFFLYANIPDLFESHYEFIFNGSRVILETLFVIFFI